MPVAVFRGFVAKLLRIEDQNISVLLLNIHDRLMELY